MRREVSPREFARRRAPNVLHRRNLFGNDTLTAVLRVWHEATTHDTAPRKSQTKKPQDYPIHEPDGLSNCVTYPDDLGSFEVGAHEGGGAAYPHPRAECAARPPWGRSSTLGLGGNSSSVRVARALSHLYDLWTIAVVIYIFTK